MSRHLAIAVIWPTDAAPCEPFGTMLAAIGRAASGITISSTFLLERRDDGTLVAPDGVPFEIGETALCSEGTEGSPSIPSANPAQGPCNQTPSAPSEECVVGGDAA